MRGAPARRATIANFHLGRAHQRRARGGRQNVRRARDVESAGMRKVLVLSFTAAFLSIAAVARAQQIAAPTRIPSSSTAAQDAAVAAGIDLHDQGKYDQAIARYQDVLKQNPDNMTALFELAFSQAAKKEYRASLETAAKGAQYKSDLLPMFYDVMASTLDMMGEPQRAIDAYKRGIELVPRASILYLNMAVTYMESLKNTEQAMLSLKKAIAIDPADTESQLLLAQLLYSANYRTPALLVFGRYLIMEPASGRSLQAYGLWRAILRGEPAPGSGRAPSKTDEGDFSAVDALIATSHSTFSSEMDGGKKETDALVKQVNAILSRLDAGDPSAPVATFIGRFHVPYFVELRRRNYVEPFVYWVSQRAPVPGVKEWVDANADRVREFLSWSAKYPWPADDVPNTK
jgi:tetratricopeptide (TPR) repeat protein